PCLRTCGRSSSCSMGRRASTKRWRLPGFAGKTPPPGPSFCARAASSSSDGSPDPLGRVQDDFRLPLRGPGPKLPRMALLEILKYPDPRLAEKSTKVEVFDDELQKLIDDM